MSNTIEKHLQRRLLLLFSNLYIMHITTVAFSPIAMFATPSQIKHRPFQPSTTTLHASLQEFSSKLSSTYPKIKSPSNYYSQFYKEGVLVGIENTSPNSRRISGEIIIDTNIDDIWSILSDYDNLSTNVPNLVESKVINNVRGIVGARPRVYQRGAIGIFGFEFGADVTMDMTENVFHDNNVGDSIEEDDHKMYSIDFECVDSQFFGQFDGAWVLEEYSTTKTMVKYIVDVMPKGPVPVAALEWRIKEDVPTNIMSVAKSAKALNEKRRSERKEMYNQLEEIPEVTQPQPSNILPRQQPPPPSTPQQQQQQPQSDNPLRQLADNTTNNIKQTAKNVLPEPIYSTARQAIKTIDNANAFQKAAIALSPNPVASVLAMTLTDQLRSGGRGNSSTKDTSRRNLTGPRRRKKENKVKLSSKETLLDTDWYEDETMATYLK